MAQLLKALAGGFGDLAQWYSPGSVPSSEEKKRKKKIFTLISCVLSVRMSTHCVQAALKEVRIPCNTVVNHSFSHNTGTRN